MIIKIEPKKIVTNILDNVTKRKKEIGLLNFYGLTDFLFVGRRVLDLALATTAVYYLLEFYLNHIDPLMKQNEFFTITYMLGVSMIPIYYCILYMTEFFTLEEELKEEKRKG